MSVAILNGDCRSILPTLPADSFDCIVTSPPYFGLRDYGVEGQIGLEATLDAYVDALCAVFDGLWRVLKPTGTAWLNLGDSYAGSWGAQSRGGPPSESSTLKGNGHVGGGPKIKSLSAIHIDAHPKGTRTGSLDKYPGLKPKDLIGVPWRVAFALQADGWWLRSAIVWAKPNPMPESVTDRPTSSYEMVFLLTKCERYFYDADAIADDSCAGETRPQTRRARELAQRRGLTNAHIAALRSCGVGDAGKAQATQSGYGRNAPDIQALADEAKTALGGYTREFLISEKRNARNVWTIATQPFKGSHFATMPPDLAERCIKAGCPRGGHVLDPFGGAGTTGLVADRLGRHATLIELNPAYRDMAAERVRADSPLFSQAAE